MVGVRAPTRPIKPQIPPHKTQVRAVENCLKRSLKRAFQHFELPAPLHLDLGIPPLDLQQAQHLVRLHFRLSVTTKGGLSSLLYLAQTTQRNLLPHDALENRVAQAFDRLGLAQHYPVWSGLPGHITSPKTKNKEKSFSNYLKQIVSKVWLKETLVNAHHLPQIKHPPQDCKPTSP